MKLPYKILPLLLLLFTLNAQSQYTEDLTNLAYGDDKQQTLDFFFPKDYNATTPVLIMLHGGAWVMGGKEYTDKTSKDLRDRGFIVINVDYRYVSETVHAADILKDIDSAIAYIETFAKGRGFGMDKLNIAGISAGAHLALLYGYTTKRHLNSITALCPPTRLDNTSELKRLGKIGLLKNVEHLANAKFKTDGEPDPKFTDASPYSVVKPIPTLLIHGNKDDLVPHEHSEFLYAILQKKNIKSKLVTMEGKGHDAGMNQPESEKKVLDEITRWIKTYN